MNVSTKFEDNSEEFLRCVRHASQEALKAAAYVYYNDVKKRLVGGFKSGAFVTGNLMNSVTRTDPVPVNEGYEILVGTNVDYAVYWELGHHNVYTRSYERVEVWMPAYLESEVSIKEEYVTVFKRILNACRGIR